MKVPKYTFCMEFNRGHILQVDISRFHTNIGVRPANVLIQAAEVIGYLAVKNFKAPR